jgi:hypothetical protein
MNLITNIFFMVIGSFIWEYYAMSFIMSNNIDNIQNSLGKIYNASIMAIFMGILEVFMNDFMMKTIHWDYYLPLLLVLFILIGLYRWQIGITDKEYLKEMIEHHSMALLTSEELLQKSSNYQVRKFASNIINNQEDEIKEMKNLIKK